MNHKVEIHQCPKCKRDCECYSGQAFLKGICSHCDYVTSVREVEKQICGRCKEDVRPTDNYCSNCGTRIPKFGVR